MEAAPPDFSPELFRHAVESAYDAILITTPGLDGVEPTIEYVNAAFERMTGWTKDEAVGRSPKFLRGSKTSEEFMQRLHHGLLGDGNFRGESFNRRKDGSEYPVEWHVSPLRDEAGEVRHWIAIHRDTSERNRQTEELERRVVERTRELEGFLYTVSHDFRAPLRAIMSASMILIEDYGEKLDHDGMAELKRQSAAARKLGVLMDDLLRLSRLSRQEMRTETVDLTALVREVAAEVAGRVVMKPEILVQDALAAEADPSLLRLLIQNLLENAVKFAKADAPARIAVGEEDGAIFVRDEGIGFPPDKAEKIFGPFERLHTEAEYPGTGVGLANVKRVVDRHGGRVWAEGRPGDGATFRFTL